MVLLVQRRPGIAGLSENEIVAIRRRMVLLDFRDDAFQVSIGQRMFR